MKFLRYKIIYYPPQNNNRLPSPQNNNQLLLPNTNKAEVIEYDCNLSPSFYENTLSELNNGYQAISFMQDSSFVRQIGYLNQVTDMNSEFVRLIGITNFINQCPWFHTTNQCISQTLLRLFVDWFLHIEPKIREYDFLHLSWYHERLYSMYLCQQNIKHKVIDGIVKHIFSESHTNNKSNSLQYFDWKLYLELNPDVLKNPYQEVNIPARVTIYDRYVKNKNLTVKKHFIFGNNE